MLLYICVYKIIGQSCRPDAARYSRVYEAHVWRETVLKQAQCLIKMFNLMLLMLNYRYARSMVLECVMSYERQMCVCCTHID